MVLAGDPAAAEDLAQEAFARTFERWGRVRTMQSPAGYVYRTAVNLQRKRLRRLAVALRRQPDQRSSPDPAAVATAHADVLAAVRSLPRSQREALMLVEWLGMDAAEAGRWLRIDPGSVRTRLHRARNSLREQLEERDE